jgi:hypothetical protein
VAAACARARPQSDLDELMQRLARDVRAREVCRRVLRLPADRRRTMVELLEHLQP